VQFIWVRIFLVLSQKYLCVFEVAYVVYQSFNGFQATFDKVRIHTSSMSSRNERKTITALESMNLDDEKRVVKLTNPDIAIIQRKEGKTRRCLLNVATLSQVFRTDEFDSAAPVELMVETRKNEYQVLISDPISFSSWLNKIIPTSENKSQKNRFSTALFYFIAFALGYSLNFIEFNSFTNLTTVLENEHFTFSNFEFNWQNYVCPQESTIDCPEKECPEFLCPKIEIPEKNCRTEECPSCPATICPDCSCPSCPGTSCPKCVCPKTVCDDCTCPETICPEAPSCPGTSCPKCVCPKTVCDDCTCPENLENSLKASEAQTAHIEKQYNAQSEKYNNALDKQRSEFTQQIEDVRKQVNHQKSLLEVSEKLVQEKVQELNAERKLKLHLKSAMEENERLSKERNSVSREHDILTNKVASLENRLAESTQSAQEVESRKTEVEHELALTKKKCSCAEVDLVHESCPKCDCKFNSEEYKSEDACPTCPELRYSENEEKPKRSRKQTLQSVLFSFVGIIMFCFYFLQKADLFIRNERH